MKTVAPVRAIVVMGPSGAGKSTLAQALASALGWRFIEGDDLHPAANVAKMRSGQPLDDADRAPWLEHLARQIHAAAGEAAGVVATCSALRRSYRDQLRQANPALLFVLPELPRAALVRRMTGRSDHYMPVSLLDSQLEALERPGPDELVLAIDGNESVQRQVERVLRQL